MRVASGLGAVGEDADPVLQLLVKLTREGMVIAAFQATHDKFRGYHSDCLRLALATSSGDRSLDELRLTLDAYTELFKEHHHAEDNYLFPALRRVDPALRTVVDQLVDQHQQLGNQLTAVLEQAHGLQSSNTRQTGSATLVEELRKLVAIVDEHLRVEEDITGPVVSAWTCWPV